MKQSLFQYTKDELAQIAGPKFRAKQIYGWMYNSFVDNFSQMQNIPKQLRLDLDDKYVINPLNFV